MQVQRGRTDRRTSDDRPCTYAGEHSSEDECITIHGIPQRKECTERNDAHANLKYKYGNRHFWAEGYYVSTVGMNQATIEKYIREQEQHDIAMDKLSVKEYEDPFEDKKKKK